MTTLASARGRGRPVRLDYATDVCQLTVEIPTGLKLALALGAKDKGRRLGDEVQEALNQWTGRSR